MIGNCVSLRGVAGYLVAVEGIGGSGKSTVARRLVQWLEAEGWPVVATREPGATALGAELRRLLLEGKYQPAPWTDAFLFEADRAETYSKVIAPALAEGKIVISDRNLYGTIAYQGFGSKLDLELVDVLNRAATQGHYPDLVLVIDIDPAVGRARKGGAADKDRFDELELGFQAAARDGYLYAAQRDEGRAHVLTGAAPADEVFARARAILAAALREAFRSWPR